MLCIFKTDITHDRVLGKSVNILTKHSVLCCVCCLYEVKVVPICFVELIGVGGKKTGRAGLNECYRRAQ